MEKVILLSSTLRGCPEFIKEGLFNVHLFMALLQLITVAPWILCIQLKDTKKIKQYKSQYREQHNTQENQEQ